MSGAQEALAPSQCLTTWGRQPLADRHCCQALWRNRGRFLSIGKGPSLPLWSGFEVREPWLFALAVIVGGSSNANLSLD